MDDDFEDECTWYPYRVVCRTDSTGEIREQLWMARDADHALERAYKHNPILMKPAPSTAKAERIWSDE